ncbi:hypothetical protein [Aeromicrobium sp. P5_D10]
MLVRPGVLPFELSIVHRLFGHAVSDAGSNLYEVVTCSLSPGEIATDADFTIAVPHGPRALDEADSVVIPASAPTSAPRSPTRRPAVRWSRPTGTVGSRST